MESQNGGEGEDCGYPAFIDTSDTGAAFIAAES
jgi:hypothetical protein